MVVKEGHRHGSHGGHTFNKRVFEDKLAIVLPGPLLAGAGMGTSPTFHLSDSSRPTNAMPLSVAEVSIADKTGPRIKSTHP